MTKKTFAVGVGALNYDILCTVERIAERGEHAAVRDVSESGGGSAANTIVGLSRLGVASGFAGAVGSDSHGKFLVEDFKRSGVDTSGIAVLKGRTGTVYGFVDAEGERTLYPYPGVNNSLAFEDLKRGHLKKATLLHMTSFVSEKQFEVQKKIAKETAARISFSPGDLYAKMGMRALKPIISKSSIVFLNESEITMLTGLSYQEGSAKLLDAGAKSVAVTLGDSGCFVRDRKDFYHLPAYVVDVVDTTGAGDAFSAGFLYGMLSGASIEKSGEYGNRVASYCIQKRGARDGLPYKKDLENKKNKNKK